MFAALEAALKAAPGLGWEHAEGGLSGPSNAIKRAVATVDKAGQAYLKHWKELFKAIDAPQHDLRLWTCSDPNRAR